MNLNKKNCCPFGIYWNKKQKYGNKENIVVIKKYIENYLKKTRKLYEFKFSSFSRSLNFLGRYYSCSSIVKF